MRVLFTCLGYIASFLYTNKINNAFRLICFYFYTGWMKRRFKKFEGLLVGKIDLHAPRYISVGANTIIFKGVRLYAWDKFKNQIFTPKITIGENTTIQDGCFISAVDKIEIGDRVAVTEHTIILDNTHGDFRDNHMTFKNNQDVPDVFLQNAFTRPLASKGPVIIGNDVHIGMFSTILPGTVIGHHSVIAAHSVVSRKIPPYSLVAGNPAEIVLTFGKKNSLIKK